MKRFALLAALFTAGLIMNGGALAEAPASSAVPATALPAGHPAVDAAKMEGQAMPEPKLTEKARVLQVISASQYTYIEISQNDKKRWLATVSVPVKKGDTIRFDTGMTTLNFNSRVLHRKFDSITFVSRVVVDNGK